MDQEYFCPEHGPYKSANGQCPYCAKTSRPGAPTPLGSNVDEIPTDPGPGGWGSSTRSGRTAPDDDMPTHISGRQSGHHGSYEDEEETAIPRSQRDRDRIDETELADELEEVGLLGVLWVKSGRKRGKVIPIKDGTVVGRKEGDPVSQVIDDVKISQPHAKFAIRNNQFVVADMLSKNGTLVNGTRIEAVTLLCENDVIQMGSTVFVLKTML
jgi:hypothetical protein